MQKIVCMRVLQERCRWQKPNNRQQHKVIKAMKCINDDDAVQWKDEWIDGFWVGAWAFSLATLYMLHLNGHGGEGVARAA
jgi:hypothetical protein